jgi:hypothetical protein
MNEDAHFQYEMTWFEEQPSLRDRIAMAALTGMIANGQHWDGQGDAEQYSRFAYEYADAMLKARTA